MDSSRLAGLSRKGMALDRSAAMVIAEPAREDGLEEKARADETRPRERTAAIMGGGGLGQDKVPRILTSPRDSRTVGQQGKICLQ